MFVFVVKKLSKQYIQEVARDYAMFSEPLDPDKGWQREDVQVAFMAGMQDKAVRRLLTVPEVAEILAVSTSVVRDLVKFGELAYVHAGRGTERKHLTFSVDEIESFIKRHTKRDHYRLEPTTRHGFRKRAQELAVERAADCGDSWIERARAKIKANEAAKKSRP